MRRYLADARRRLEEVETAFERLADNLRTADSHRERLIDELILKGVVPI